MANHETKQRSALLKRALSNVLRVAGIAAAVLAVATFVFTPLNTEFEILMVFGSLALGIVCLIASDEIGDEHGSTSLWPPRSTK
jgi:hypothetical protein